MSEKNRLQSAMYMYDHWLTDEEKDEAAAKFEKEIEYISGHCKRPVYERFSWLPFYFNLASFLLVLTMLMISMK